MTEKEFIETIRSLKETDAAKEFGEYSNGIYFAIGYITAAYCKCDAEKNERLMAKINK
jgi:hypothetical protein